ncbi:MAG: ABC transporter substrate-binding protein [Thermomicrobiales bacterium]
MTSIPQNEADRLFQVGRIMGMGGNRRDLLKAAFAAGLIPVLTLADVAEQAAAQEGEPVQGGTFFTLGHQDITKLSPEDNGADVVFANLMQLFNGMYYIDHNYQLVPSLAESYEVSEDGLTYTFKLKTGITFHNGDSFSSADVKYTFDWIMNPDNGSTRAGNFDLVASVEAPDETTVVVTLSTVDVSFLVNVLPIHIYPSAYHAEVGEEAFGAAPIGTGPFYLADSADYSPAAFLELQAYEGHFNGRPNFDTWRMDIAPEAAGRFVALQSGAADNSVWTLSSEDNHTLADGGGFTVYTALSVGVNHLPLNNNHPFLSDKQARKALITGLDRAATLEAVYLGDGELATSNLSPAAGDFYNPDVTAYPYDPEAAATLLEEAGWVAGGDGIREKDGVKASFVITAIAGDTQRRPIAEIAQALWSELGIDVSIEEAQVGDILATLPNGELDASLFNWTYGGGNGEPDARDTLGTGGPNNFSQFSNARVDELLALGVTQQDLTERQATYHEIQAIVADEVPFVFNAFPINYTFYNERVKGLPESVLSSLYILQNAYKLWKVE